ncbi:unnamed protein product [Ilex paraguariensis]|uniref:Uncharacterized protein n=1 Tax=Ilex paraguariensis TaxID=185542 RepID=A0ABC8UTB2_9AQUA
MCVIIFVLIEDPVRQLIYSWHLFYILNILSVKTQTKDKVNCYNCLVVSMAISNCSLSDSNVKSHRSNKNGMSDMVVRQFDAFLFSNHLFSFQIFIVEHLKVANDSCQ